MSTHSYTKMWVHLIWGTKNHNKSLIDREFRKEVSKHLAKNSKEKNIYMKINYVNSDHVHALIDLPTNMTIEDASRLLKGESSNWINNNVDFKFGWGKGYGAFSVSESNLNKVVRYIMNQEEHHRNHSFTEEYNSFLRTYNINKK